MKKTISILSAFLFLTSITNAQDTVTAKEDVHINKGTYSSGSTGNGLGNLILFGDGSNGGGWQSSIKWSGLDGFNYGASTGTRVNAEITVGSIGSYGKADLVFKTKGTNDNATPTEKLRITSLGNMGLGTSTPSATLHIKDIGNSSVTSFQINNRIKFRGDGVIDWGSGADYGILSWNTGKAIIGGKSGKDLSLMADASEKVVIKTDGDVGIGTSSPNSKLHIAGDGAVIKLQDNSEEDTSDAFYGWIGGYDKSGDEIWWLGEGSSSSKQLGLFTSRDGYDLKVQNKGKGITVKNSGYVGIGTNTPDSELAVNGKIHAQEVKVDLVGWPDYVFENNYSLPTLQEVEQHIIKNGHLQNIPSAAEVEKNGIQLGEMNKKLLEKIEELTLYMIEQNKKTEQLQKEVIALKKKNIELEKRLK